MRDSPACTQRYENPVRCEKCKAFWDFKTDAIGRLIAVHPISKCIAPSPVVYETEDDDPKMAEPRKCLECEKMFRPRMTRSNAKVCSSKCRQERRARYHKLWMRLYGQAA